MTEEDVLEEVKETQMLGNDVVLAEHLPTDLDIAGFLAVAKRSIGLRVESNPEVYDKTLHHLVKAAFYLEQAIEEEDRATQH